MNAKRPMSSKAMKASLIAPCVMNCRLCRAYVREKKPCSGCHGNDDQTTRYLARCRIRNCEMMTAGRSRYCFECSNYPCAVLKHLDKRYRTRYGMSMIDNLEYIKQSGIRNFIRREKQRWACPECGDIISVHKENCISCGSKRRFSHE